MKPFGNGRAEKGVSLVDFPDGVADIVCRGLFDEVALRETLNKARFSNFSYY
jgi:hypothetical protein